MGFPEKCQPLIHTDPSALESISQLAVSFHRLSCISSPKKCFNSKKKSQNFQQSFRCNFIKMPNSLFFFNKLIYMLLNQNTRQNCRRNSQTSLCHIYKPLLFSWTREAHHRPHTSMLWPFWCSHTGSVCISVYLCGFSFQAAQNIWICLQKLSWKACFL